ncbi:hypothetical protein RRG08_025751 [Elysia crispata]|nr:hypothetical protein RRG08_025751 [Elysia crispata]
MQVERKIRAEQGGQNFDVSVNKSSEVDATHLKEETMAHSKRVQALLKRFSCIPLVNRFRHDEDGDGARTAGDTVNASEGAAAASTSTTATPTKKVPKPGSKKPKKQKSFSDLDKGSKRGQHALVYRCGLTVRQVFSIKQSWKAIQREETTFGVEMFIR